MDKLIYLKTNVVPKVWIIGLVFGSILLSGKIIENIKYKKFCKEQQQKELQRLQNLKNKSNIGSL